ncbi:MAG: preprotein translocase subunit YajC [Actinomycetota bacterium]
MEQILPFLLIAVFAYVALIYPQQKRTRTHRELMASLTEGDEVVLNSGIHGFIASIEDDVIWLEVSPSPSVELKVARNAVTGKIEQTDDVEDD